VHENVAHLFAVFQHEAFLWVVAEYAEFGSVKLLLALLGNGMVEDDALAVWGQTARGLAFLHEHNVLHRDVCAANIVLDKTGTAKLAGTLMLFAVDTSRDLAGTLTHAAPEVVWGTDYGVACDIWSLGITLLELRSGAAPHEVRDVLSCLVLVG
jgi:serine/threonine protein kinase